MNSKDAVRKTCRRSRPTAGFTLMEVIVAIGVGLVVGTLVVRLYLLSYKGLDVQHEKLKQMRTVRTLLYGVKRDLRAAESVLPRFRAYRSDEHTLILALPGLDDAGLATPAWRDVVVYRSTADGVQRLVVPDRRSRRPGGEAILTGGETSLSFDYSETDLTRCTLVTVGVADNRTVHRRESRFPTSVTVRLRNHR